MLSWQFFKHYLLSKRAGALIRVISWLCIVGIMVGVMSLLVVISVMNGFNDQMRGRLFGLQPHLTIIPGVDEQFSADGLMEFARKNKIAVEEVAEVDSRDVIIRTLDGSFSGAVAKGLDEAALDSFYRRVEDLQRKSKINEFEVIRKSEDNEWLGPKEISIGVELARSLGVFEGDQVILIPPEILLKPKSEKTDYERVVIKSILVTRVADLDSKVVFYNKNKTLKRLSAGASGENGFEVRFKNPDDYRVVETAIEKKHPLWRVESWPERDAALFFALKMEKMMMTIFLSLSALITSFSIVSVLSLLLSQKRKDIGVLLTIGLSPTRTRRVFIMVGMILSGVGVVSGLTLGSLACYILATSKLELLPDIYYDSVIPAHLSWSMVGWVCLASLVVAFVTSYYPARQLTDLNPAAALRK